MVAEAADGGHVVVFSGRQVLGGGFWMAASVPMFRVWASCIWGFINVFDMACLG